MANKASSEPDLGTGVYTYSEAARLLQVRPARVRRWAQGYLACRKDREIRKEPVLQSESAHTGIVTFPDLVEMMFVKFFLEQGIRLTEIAACAERLSAELDTLYPFACERLQTDGSQLIQCLGDHFRNPATTQLIFDFVAEFFKNIDFDPITCLAERWYPMGRDHKVFVDSHKSFGAPVVEERNIRTDILYATYKAEDRDVELVADWYDVSQESVRAAVEFEEQWRKAA